MAEEETTTAAAAQAPAQDRNQRGRRRGPRRDARARLRIWQERHGGRLVRSDGRQEGVGTLILLHGPHERPLGPPTGRPLTRT